MNGKFFLLKRAMIVLAAGFLCVSQSNAADATNQASQTTTGNKEPMQIAQESQTTSLSKGEQFLAENKTKPGVVTLPDGLQYKILTEGKGAKPGPTDRVTVHYTGKLIDGTVFDSSIKRGQPATFPVNGVIAGWTEALQLMPVGSTWELYIPAGLAYGSMGAPPVIGPNETLIFEVQLLDTQKA